jgi:hypothetical protein
LLQRLAARGVDTSPLIPHLDRLRREHRRRREGAAAPPNPPLARGPSIG